MHTVFNQGLWIASGSLLFVVAFVRFNRPPTNRTATTFLLFYTGLLFYYALLIGLWILVIVLLSTGSYGIDGIGTAVALSLKANEWLSPSLPVIALLVIAVASQFGFVARVDTGARQLCFQLAAIPAEAEQLAIELAHGELQLRDRGLVESVSQEITKNIGANALRFANDGSLAARFTRAVSLYWLFVMPDNAGTAVSFPASLSGRSAYARIMRLNEKTVEQSIALYDTLMENALACFTSSKPTRQMEEALKKNIQALSLAVCRLIARYVLYLDLTESQRRKRLSGMGLNPRDHSPAFGLDQWVASILVIIVFFMFMSLLIPGRQPFSQNFMYSVLMAIQLGLAVIAGTVVAQRFVRRQEDNVDRFPPLAELTVSALVVVGLCIVLRIGWPLIQDLLNTGGMSLSKSVEIFLERWPFVLLPFICTYSIGLISAYAGPLSWGWLRLSILGGVLNAAAFAAGSYLVGQLLAEEFLNRIQGDPQTARLMMMGTLSITGFVLGWIVLAIFPRSIRAGRTAAILTASEALPASADNRSPKQLTDVPEAPVSRLEGRRALKDLGGYSRESVEDLEGRYVCFRPTFTNPAVINAYEITIRWDDTRACLIFEERNRPDSLHSQLGQVYVPDGRPFMSLVTMDKGAVRVIMVARPDDHDGVARGLILTLSNPGGVHFIPASAPVVLRRLKEATPQVGFVHSDAPDYAPYLDQLGTVAPDFAIFATLGPALKVVRSSASQPRS